MTKRLYTTQQWKTGMKRRDEPSSWRWESAQDNGFCEQQLDRSTLLTPSRWITRLQRTETTQTIQKMGNNSKKQKQNFKTLHCLFVCMYACRVPTEIRGQGPRDQSWWKHFTHWAMSLAQKFSIWSLKWKLNCFIRNHQVSEVQRVSL